MDKAQSGDEKFKHIGEKDINTVIETVANAESWLGNLIARQAERPNDLKPVVTSAEITRKKEE
jgi:heat shock protein 4